MKFMIGKRLFGQAIRTAHAFGNSDRTRQRSGFRYPVDLVASPLGLEISAFDGNAVLTQRVPAGVSVPGSVSINTDELRGALVGPNARDIVTFEAGRDAAAMAACRLLDGDKAAGRAARSLPGGAGGGTRGDRRRNGVRRLDRPPPPLLPRTVHRVARWAAAGGGGRQVANGDPRHEHPARRRRAAG